VSASDEIRYAAGQLKGCWLSAVSYVEHEAGGPATNLRYRVDQDTRVEFADDGADATLSFDAEIVWIHPEDKEFESPFDLKLTITGSFEWAETMPDKELREAWLEWNGAYLLWPYLRAQVAAITGASSVETMTLYTMRVPEPPPSVEESKDAVRARRAAAKAEAASSETADAE
jgi:hypothetical protein